MYSVLLFDVNETLLDLAPLRKDFQKVFKSTDVLGEWFARLLHGSLVANHTNRYRAFGLIGAESLVALAERKNIPMSADRAADIVGLMRSLPAHKDVPKGLARLQEHEYRLVALTNGSDDVVEDQLKNANISQYFERALSVDSVQRFKPSPEPYIHATAMLDVTFEETLMIAAHDWDIIGARAVGIDGAYLNRPGVSWGLPDGPPGLVAPDLKTLATLLTQNS